jgi:hypothetical protein
MKLQAERSVNPRNSAGRNEICCKIALLPFSYRPGRELAGRQPENSNEIRLEEWSELGVYQSSQ